MSYLVANPEDRFTLDEAHIMYSNMMCNGAGIMIS